MTTFKVGDKIRCIDGKGAAKGIKEGETYEVERDDASGLQIVGVYSAGGHWRPRFELAKPEVKVTVRTKEQVWADRTKELLDGIVATHTAGQEIPREWIEELYFSSAR